MSTISMAWVALTQNNIVAQVQDALKTESDLSKRDAMIIFLGTQVTIRRVVVPPQNNKLKDKKTDAPITIGVYRPILPSYADCHVSPIFSGSVEETVRTEAEAWLAQTTDTDALTFKVYEALGIAFMLMRLDH